MPSTPRLLWLHFGSHRWLKIVGVTIFMTVFFTGYILLLKAPQFPVTEMPVTALDRLVGFQPATLILYVLLWPYVSLAPMCLHRREQLFDYLRYAIVLSLVGMAFYLFWPTASPPPPDVTRSGGGFWLLERVDSAGNAFPSLHVAFAVFTAIWFDPLLRQMRGSWLVRSANLLLCLGIVYSTMGTKQHVAVDVYAGAVLGTLFGIALRKRLAARPFPPPTAIDG